jgi:septal ring factor EnvC (AmiA/AmiB activator)
MENSIWTFVWNGVYSLFLVLFTFKLQQNAKKQADTDERIARVHDDLAEHKLDVAKNYAKHAEVQHSLDRIHSRIDNLPKEIAAAMRDTIQIVNHTGRNQ